MNTKVHQGKILFQNMYNLTCKNISKNKILLFSAQEITDLYNDENAW